MVWIVEGEIHLLDVTNGILNLGIGAWNNPLRKQIYFFATILLAINVHAR